MFNTNNKMQSNPAEHSNLHLQKLSRFSPEDEIVISGLAGRFQKSDNTKQLQENLMSKSDLVTDGDRRWKLDQPEVPQRTGKIRKLRKFDALFFGTQPHQLLDAGRKPRELRGSNCGVFVGACFSESQEALFYDEARAHGVSGCSRSTLANRLSCWLEPGGPSYAVEAACSAALVASGHLCLRPCVSMQFSKLAKARAPGSRGRRLGRAVNSGLLRRPAGAGRPLQVLRRGRARGAAAEARPRLRDPRPQRDELRRLQGGGHRRALEPHAGQAAARAVRGVRRAGRGGWLRRGPRHWDEEVEAIDAVLGRDRARPLLSGSVESNLGHSEPASGLVAIAKVLLDMEHGVVPPNIHFVTPRQDIESIKDGRVKVVTEPTPWEGDFAGVNSFEFGGTNADVLLKRHDREKINNGAPEDDLMRLAVVSGRTIDAVDFLLSDLESKPVDVEYLKLLHDIHSYDITGHLYRAYTLLPPRGITKFPVRKIEAVSGTKRPVLFIFTGIGSQWPGMGEALLKIPVFFKAIERCGAVLKPHGIDIFHIIVNKDKRAFNITLNSYVGIVAIQIGLIEILRTIGIVPDTIIGHSMGELACAYADGCFTAEQTILAAYYRGLACIETKLVRGAMSAVALGYEQLKPMCPPDVDVACHNSADNASISGPAESVQAFVAELQAKSIMAKEVLCSDIAYHSRYIAPVGPKFLAYLRKLIPQPKARSPKWLSTSVPIDKWDTPAARLSSAEYHANNLLKPVLFEETLALVPKDAIVIEIAPHGLFQPILHRALGPGVANISLARKHHRDNVEVLFQALGKMFNVGLNYQLANLYPHVEYPVSRSTQIISPLIKWDHSEDWYVADYRLQCNNGASERIVKVHWRNDWIAFIDNMLQLKILTTNTRELLVPTGIKKLVIDTNAHLDQIKSGEQEKKFPVYVDKLHDIVVSGGIEIHGPKFSAISRRKSAYAPILEEYKFVPLIDNAEVNTREVVKLFTQIAAENYLGVKIKTVELLTESVKLPFENRSSSLIAKPLDEMPLYQAETFILSNNSKFGGNILPTNFSSLACGRGNLGASNYGTANSVMERICEKRVLEGFPAVAIQWSSVGDVGIVADMQTDHKELLLWGTRQQGIASYLHELDGLLLQNRPIVSSIVVAGKVADKAGPLKIAEATLHIMGKMRSDFVESIGYHADRHAGLKDLKGVELSSSLSKLGMDSIVSVGIKQTFERDFNLFLTAQDIRGLSFAKLMQVSEEVASKSGELQKL